MISILLPAYKSEYLLKKVFLPSLKHCKTRVEVVLRDNGGNGDALHYALTTHWNDLVTIKVVYSGEKDEEKKNIGLNRGLNECAKVAEGDFFFLPHTDMHLLPNWDTKLLEATKNQVPGSYLFCSRSIEPSQGHTRFHVIRDYGREPEEFQEQRMLLECGDLTNDTSIVTGYRMPFFMHRKLWEKMEKFNITLPKKQKEHLYQYKKSGKIVNSIDQNGGVDVDFWSYGTDDDLFMTAYHLNVRKFWMINGSLVYHLQGKSNKVQNVDNDAPAVYEGFKTKWKHIAIKTHGSDIYNTNLHIDQMMFKLVPWYIMIK